MSAAKTDRNWVTTGGQRGETKRSPDVAPGPAKDGRICGQARDDAAFFDPAAVAICVDVRNKHGPTDYDMPGMWTGNKHRSSDQYPCQHHRFDMQHGGETFERLYWRRRRAILQ
jgi:hypothetical protein